MRCLIRRVTGRGKESLEYHDSEIVADSITIGWAVDQTVSLHGTGVEARHARILPRWGGAFEIRAHSAADTRVNGKLVESASLKPGDVIEIGAHGVTVLAPVPGFDLAFQVEVGVEKGGRAAVPAYAREQAPAWITKARLSWMLVVGILTITFAVPVAGLFSERVRDTLRTSAFLPSDRLWDTGPLAAGHAIPEIGDNCTVCHQQPFRRVTNAACGACHEGVTHHVPEDSALAAEFLERRCTSCHKEHKEPGQIVRQDQLLCTACHADTEMMESAEVDLKLASDFGDDHPAFRLTMLVPGSGDGEPAWVQRRVDMAEEVIRERSHLKFNHQTHLDPEGVEAPDGKRVMQCGDCHIEDAAGALMRPITMEAQCRACHSLAFDENAPDRELPHGHLADVIASLEEYYSRLGLARQPDVELAKARTRVARRPGKTSERTEPDRVLAWARQEARKTAEDLLERTVCYTCHEVTRLKESEMEEPAWRVEPVKLNNHWMPYARFNHRQHAMEECSACHAAADSEKSGDVLMPDIETCRDCHGGEASETKLRSACTACHYLHNPQMGPLYAGTEIGN